MNEMANTNDAGLILLDNLAAQARMLTENIAMNMLQLGRVFAEAKRLVEHGKWSAWVQENSGMSERYAQQFMQAYARYGQNEQFAKLGKSKLIKLLALPEGEEERFIAENDVEHMSSREVEEAVRAERAVWQEKVAEANRAKDEAIRRAEDAITREPEIPEGVLRSIQDKDMQISRQKDALRQMASQNQEMLDEAFVLRTENARLKQENADRTDMLREIQDDLDRTQRELLDARSDMARGDAERIPADQLTLDSFSAAVRQFIGTVARMPHMRITFASLPYEKKTAYSELLSTVEQWAADSRKAIDAVLSKGSVV